MGFKNSLFYGTILHSACLSKNVELVKHLIQTQSIDINTKNVFIYILMTFYMFKYLILFFLLKMLWHFKNIVYL